MWCQQVSWCLFCYYAEKLPLKRMRGCTFLPSLLKSKSGFTKLKRFSHVGEVTKIADGLRLKKITRSSNIGYMSPKLLGWTPFKHLSVYTWFPWFPSQKISWLWIHRQNATSKSSASPGKLAFWAVFSCFFVFFGVGDGFRPPLKKTWKRKNKKKVGRWLKGDEVP